MRKGGSDAANEVETQEFPVSEPVLNAPAEDPKKEHVAQQVPSTRMQEHGPEQGNDQPHDALRQPALRSGVTSRHDAEYLDEMLQPIAERELEQESSQIQANQNQRYDGPGLSTEVVLQWYGNHAEVILHLIGKHPRTPRGANGK